MPTEQTLELRLDVADVDVTELEVLTRQLREQLKELDVESVAAISAGPAPDDSKALDLIVIGGLLVKLGPAAVSAVVGVVQAWVGRDAGRSVTMRRGDREITVTKATEDQQARLVEAFLAGDDG